MEENMSNEVTHYTVVIGSHGGGPRDIWYDVVDNLGNKQNSLPIYFKSRAEEIAKALNDELNGHIDFPEMCFNNFKIKSKPFPQCFETPSFPIPEYKFYEDEILKDITEYINSTYNSHYADDERKIQNVEYVMDQHDCAFGFLKGNLQKYSSRYGHKDGRNKKDLMKTIHYAILLMYYDHYRNNKTEKNT